jgi:amino acid permease
MGHCSVVVSDCVSLLTRKGQESILSTFLLCLFVLLSICPIAYFCYWLFVLLVICSIVLFVLLLYCLSALLVICAIGCIILSLLINFGVDEKNDAVVDFRTALFLRFTLD